MLRCVLAARGLTAWLLVALAFGYPLAVTACAPPRAAPGGPITLRWLTVDRGEPGRAVAQAAVETFRQANPAVTVEVEAVPAAEYGARLAAALDAGAVDVFDIAGERIAEYAARDALLGLDASLDRNDWQDFVEVERHTATESQRIVSFPWFAVGQALFYNAALLEAAGVPPARGPDDGWTWSETLEAARRLTRPGPSGATEVWGLVVEQPDAFDVAGNLLLSNRARPVASDDRTAAGSLNSDEAVEAAAFYGDLFARWRVSPANPPPGAFARGQAALFLADLTLARTLAEGIPNLKFGVMPVPYFKRPITLTGSWHVGVYKRTAYPRRAVELARTITGPGMADALFRTLGALPVRRSALDRFAADFRQPPLSLYASEVKYTAVRPPSIPAYSAYSAGVEAAFRQVIAGGNARRELDAAAAALDRSPARP